MVAALGGGSGFGPPAPEALKASIMQPADPISPKIIALFMVPPWLSINGLKNGKEQWR
jgi:hypothetical protein